MSTETALTYGAPADRARAVCIFVHGRGQSPEAMIDFVLARVDLSEVHVILPRAPKGSWYDAKAVDLMTEATATQLGEAFAAIDTCADTADAMGLGRPFLGGFSQGACTALEYAFRRPERIAGLAVLTGCRVGLPDAPAADMSLSGLPVYASCSNRDPWIPLDAFVTANGHLAACQTELTVEVIPGRDHSVSDREAQMFEAMLAAPDFRLHHTLQRKSA
jgi:phospholipase/carboxylesterase